MNPLLLDFNTAPFSKIASSDYKPAIKKAIEIAKNEIDKIVSNPENPTFDNTTVALDGAKNAGILAAQIIDASDELILNKILAYKEELKLKVNIASERVRK